MHGGLISIQFYKKNVAAISSHSSPAALKCDTPFLFDPACYIAPNSILKLIAASQLYPAIPMNLENITHICITF
jgi:hypothetical protein